MFIRLTRLDSRPVWLNAAFIVTVEPRRDGKGAVVVPIGDGLDYDVRETPEEVLRMLDGCPAPKVVPVPVSDCLTKTPADVSPEPQQPVGERRAEEEKRVEAQPAAAEPPKARPEEADPGTAAQGEAQPAEAASAAEAPPAAQPAEAQPEEAAPAEKPKRRTRKAVAAKPAKAMELELQEEDVVRLQKLSPKSVAKLKNTLVSQFRVTDVSGAMAALAAKGVLSLDGNHVNWNVK